MNPASVYEGPRMARVTPSIPGFDPERAALVPLERTSAERRALARRDDHRKAQALMHMWISRPDLQLETVARELGMTPRQLQRVFHSQRSDGFRAELLEMRMVLAAKLLDSQKPISEIAAAVGYRGPMHFAKAFRRRWGSSPRQYRNSLVSAKSPKQSSGSARLAIAG